MQLPRKTLPRPSVPFLSWAIHQDWEAMDGRARPRPPPCRVFDECYSGPLMQSHLPPLSVVLCYDPTEVMINTPYISFA
jgi:hypothetical protein